MTNPEGPLQRGWRPAVGWGGVVLIVFCLLFLFAASLIALFALWRWSNGQPVDLTGFAALMGAAVPAGAAIWSLVKQSIIGRTTQHVEAIRSGQGVPPFGSAPPSAPAPATPPAGPPIDDLDGPRPGGNWQ